MHQILHDSLTSSSIFWNAAAAIATFAAVIVALLLHWFQHHATRKDAHRRSGAILPSLREELIEALDLVRCGIELGREARSNVGRRSGSNGIVVTFGNSVNLDAKTMQFVVSNIAREKLIAFTKFDIGAWIAYRNLVSDLPRHIAEELFSGFADISRQAKHIAADVAKWPDIENLGSAELEIYDRAMNRLYARMSRLIYFLSNTTGTAPPARLVPRDQKWDGPTKPEV